MEVLRDVVARHQGGAEVAEAAAAVVSRWRDRGDRVPGFGHRVHSADPRTARLLGIADSLGFRTVYDDAAREVEAALTRTCGKSIPMNLDGAIAAVLCGLDFPAELANPLFMASRFVGISMQAYEERTRHRPMRRIHADRFQYDGVPLREIEKIDGVTR
jgi:citrate synthase